MEFNEDGTLKIEIKHNFKFPDISAREMNKELREMCDSFNFNPSKIIIEGKYLGSIDSKRNRYHGFELEDNFLISTGIKSKTNFNLITRDESDELKKIIDTQLPDEFTVYDIIDSLLKVNPTNLRLRFLVKEYKLFHETLDNTSKPYRIVYNFILQCCYSLCLRGLISIDPHFGRKVLFSNFKSTTSLDHHIFKDISYVGDIVSEKYKKISKFITPELIDSLDKHLNINISDTIVLKDKKFYYTIKNSTHRGSIYSYFISEVDYLHKLIKKFPDQIMDIHFLIKKMDYQKRFLEIYNLMIEQNLRNERDEFYYFNSRLKTVLRIIEILYKDIISYKDGREIKFKLKSLEPESLEE